MEHISIREYARRRGCSEANVRKACDLGHIAKGVAYDPATNKRIGIYPDIADQEWAANRNPDRTTNTKLIENLEAAGGRIPDKASDTATYNRAKLAKVALEAKLLELKYQTELGNLVEKSKVDREMFAFGQMVREAMLAIPNRVVDHLMAAPTRLDAVTLLTDAINEALTRLSEYDNINLKS